MTNRLMRFFNNFKNREHSLSTEEHKTSANNDSWFCTFNHLDNVCERFPVSQVFSYIAALALFDIPMSLDCLSYMCGIKDISVIIDILDRKDLLSPIMLDNGLLLFKSDNFPNEYFRTSNEVNDNVSPESCLADLIKKDMLNEDTIISFEKAVFSLRYFYIPDDIPFNTNIRYLMDLFKNNDRYMRILINNKRIHSFEFAQTFVSLHDHGLDQADFEDYCDNMISSSFKKVTDYYIDGNHSDRQENNYFWIKYFNFASPYMENIPSALLEYVSETTYRQISNLLQKYTSNLSKRSDWDPNQLRHAESYAIDIYKKILLDINGNDVPACLQLGNYYLKKHDFENARFYFSRISQTSSSFTGITSTISSYEKEIRFLLDQKYRQDDKISRIDCNRRIREINERLSILYKDWEDRLEYSIKNASEEDSQESTALQASYVTLMTKYARHEKDRGHFNDCYQILNRIPNTYPEIFRAYTELGMLYQSLGNKNNRNPFHDYDKAIAQFQKAISELNFNPPDRSLVKAKLGILMPLANTYYLSRNLIKAEEVCNEVLQLNSNEKNAIKLINMINQARKESLLTA